MSRARSTTANSAPAIRVPLAPRTLWRVLMLGAVLLLAGALVTGMLVARVPQKIAFKAATAASRAGFTVRQVDIDGIRHQPRLDIYQAILEGGSDALMLVDLPGARERLLDLPWVADASIRRRWPDGIEVSITERKPAAIWQYQGKLTLVDVHGTPLPSEKLEDFAHLPLVVGSSAAKEFTELQHLLASNPAIADEMLAAVRIGGRRWDLRMKSGETLSLPEGDKAKQALTHFTRLNAEQQLLGQGFVRFDLRIPDKMVVRVSRETGAKARPSAHINSGPRQATEVTI